MYRVGALSWLQLTRLIVGHTITSFVIVLNQGSSNCEIRCVTHDVVRTGLAGNCQYRRLSQAGLECIKCLLTVSSPLQCSTLLSCDNGRILPA
ncbi:hypothetical protein PR003_g13584 [Phytophthora rubi]|uniref:Secreted protein n=1 Tax=Phytophthora rubi TaxID=129364 RepID=A0A6A3JVM3_9STRA|nr:hypothetical protein PR002_g19305 [Phytophthora rubi]KAE9031690.1 hypothetical protein PR001_g10950 [Phytophthora rubi]KAE9334299.1 hypothetical protein PR003_g13584 [Phytophthora rubi]